MDNEIMIVPESDDTSDTVKERQAKQKVALLDELKRMPIIEYSCKKCGVGRTTFYRWKKEDEEFARNVDEALEDGVGMVNDLSESQLLSAIRDRELSAIFFWLKARHPAYSAKLEVINRQTPADDKLSSVQDDLANKILQFINKENIIHDDSNTQSASNKSGGNDQSIKPVGAGSEGPEISGQK